MKFYVYIFIHKEHYSIDFILFYYCLDRTTALSNLLRRRKNKNYFSPAPFFIVLITLYA